MPFHLAATNRFARSGYGFIFTCLRSPALHRAWAFVGESFAELRLKRTAHRRSTCEEKAKVRVVTGTRELTVTTLDKPHDVWA